MTVRPRAFNLPAVTALALLVAFLAVVQCSLAARPKAAARPAGPRKQIYEASHTVQTSESLGASGVAAYVVSSMGTNRGFLIKDLSGGGLARSAGMSEGDVVLSLDGHIVQSANDVDRALSGIERGSVRVMFVHVGDAGLQLYNAPVAFTYTGPAIGAVAPAGSGVSGASTRESTMHAAAAKGTVEFLPSAETYAIELINKDRQMNGGHRALPANGTLAQMARSQAEDIIKRNFFSHTNPDGMGPEQRAAKFGISSGVYENIAYEVCSNGKTPAQMV
ncbi:MAG: CAP domain-containing protein, partial [Terriglobales bacterium]